MNRQRFFDRVRAGLFGGTLNAQQVQGLELLLDAMQAARWPASWASYGLATAFHEVAQTMQPIREHGGPAYFTRMYDITGKRPALARKMGNTRAGDGIRFCGRGYVQLTWRVNYERAGDALGIDLVSDPDLAMEPAIAARIMVMGMSEGWFTGKKNADYLNPVNPDYRNARRIINGMDKADLIAGYARVFESALVNAGYDMPARPAAQSRPVEPPPRPAAPAAPPPQPPPAAKPASEPRKGLWGRFLDAINRSR